MQQCGRPMTTTTIRIDDALKARVAAAAERVGKSSHAFILDSVAEAVDRLEQETAFHNLADERWANLLATGETIPWDQAKAWIQTRAKGEHPQRPASHKIGP
jgi:predicted transcriptional regulator